MTYRYEERFSANSKIKTTRVDIKIVDGSCYSREIYVASGGLRNPIARHDLPDKYGDCVFYPAKPLSREKKQKRQ